MSDLTHAKQFKREIFSIVDRLKEMQVDLRSLNVISVFLHSKKNFLRRLLTALDPFEKGKFLVIKSVANETSQN